MIEMLHSPYMVLDLPEGATESDIEKAYDSLSKRLAPDSFRTDAAKEQAAKCLKAITEAYRSLKNTDGTQKRAEPVSTNSDEMTHPRLGQMCVATGIISMEQLEQAVQEQLKTGLPLGEVLENKQFLSRAELEGLLLGQGLIDVDGERKDPVAQRLIALNLATLDMVLIAQMEMKWQELKLTDVFIKHGWLSADVAEALFQN
jgi:hypothetical protein